MTEFFADVSVDVGFGGWALFSFSIADLLVDLGDCLTTRI
jgi:hypothetical protein